MRRRLLATGIQLSCKAMAKRDKRVRIVTRKLWTAIGFAACPGTKSQLCFVLRPARCVISSGQPQSGMTWIRIKLLANAIFS
jgi:hypothetical protein